MPPRPSLPTTLAAVMVLAGVVSGAAAPAPALAAGLGQGLATPVLGQLLDFAAPLRLEAGESIDPRCVSSEVTLGERQLAPAAVRTTLESTGGQVARVRVTSLQPIDEPVVTIMVTAGCTSSVSRRYVLFADPPGIERAAAPPTSAPVATAPAFAVSPPPVPESMATAPSGQTGPSESAAPIAAATPAGEAAPPSARATALTAARSADADARPAPAPTPPARARPAVRRSPATASTTGGAASRRAAAAPVPSGTPRLRLEAAEPPPATSSTAQVQAVEDALAAVAQAASAARAATAAASAASQRIAELERTVSQLRSEAQAEREQGARLRERLAGSDSTSRWLTPLAVLVVILTGVALWLAWRVTALQRQRDIEWQSVVSPPATPRSEGPSSRQPTAPVPFVVSEVVTTPGAPVRAGSAPAWPPPVPLSESRSPGAAAGLASLSAAADDFDPLRTQPLSGPGSAGADAARDVSIEELIDLEQQAEFFVVLGQDDAAIDLLVEHLRHTGGSSPLPYLKLLEIYGHRGDREAYERMRARFNRRFNAYAPEWGADLSHGRTLEDYPGVIPRLQQLWGRPENAMAELEALLFRKDRGELFDLPAYREVLFLYSLARDLLDREALATGSVDLLLPMAGGSDELGPTSADPHLGAESDGLAPGASEDRATMPVDLDLSRPEPPGNIFDLPDDLPTRPRPL